MSDKLYRMISGIFVLTLVLLPGFYSHETLPNLRVDPLPQIILLFSQLYPHLKHHSWEYCWFISNFNYWGHIHSRRVTVASAWLVRWFLWQPAIVCNYTVSQCSSWDGAEMHYITTAMNLERYCGRIIQKEDFKNILH